MYLAHLVSPNFQIVAETPKPEESQLSCILSPSYTIDVYIGDSCDGSIAFEGDIVSSIWPLRNSP